MAALFIGLAAAAAAAAIYAGAVGRWLPAVLALAVAAMVLFAWRMSGDLEPTKLWLQGSDAVVQTKRHLVRRSIASATGRRLEATEVEHLQRLVSAGIFFTTAGGFDSRRLGEFDLYATDLGNAVLIELEDEQRLVVTPDDPDAFLAALAEHQSAAD